MIEINKLTKEKISEKKIKKILARLTKIFKIKKDVSLAFVTSKRIKELNKTYLKKDKITDVLSFPGESNLLGEVVISLEQAQKQAREQKHSLEKEVKILTLHGILHLLGFDHKTEKDQEKMEKKEKELLKS